ncbi:MAG TPA: hypothetical protein VML96_09270 [Egibacteraceae bacterium]|nr:hypothetical protein [Egibacteraceae bacterium]
MSGARMLFWVTLAASLALAAADAIPLSYVVAGLAAVLIWRTGTASLRSLRSEHSFVPSGAAQPVDSTLERVVYACEGCGTEVLLLMRGTELPPRHCGERMLERREPVAAPN